MKGAVTYIASVEIPVGDEDGYPCFENREDAQKWCDNWNSQLADAIADPECGIEMAKVVEVRRGAKKKDNGE
jgi:hypothetical protein